MFNQKTALLFGLMAIQNPQFFPLKDLHPGMSATGYTVFSSLKGIEPFQVQILGRMQNYVGPSQDLIIARLLDERFKNSSVVAGMSGSPVYVNGKLLGALSYSFGRFTTEAVAGITPIDSMLGDMGAQAVIPSLTRDLVANSGPRVKHGVTENSDAMRPISLPLVAQGLSPVVAQNFGPELIRRGLALPQLGAGGFGSSSMNMEKLKPGASFAALLISGDMNVSCLGTVTWVQGTDFVGLGHPFLQNGVSELPVAGAEIVTTIFGQQDPYKMGQPTQILGALTSDRSSGLTGVIGKKARTLPLDIQIGDRKMHYEIARLTRDTPFLAAMAISNSLAMGQQHELGGTYELQVKAKIIHGEELSYDRMITASGLPLEPAAIASFLEPVTMLQEQDYQKIEFEHIRLQVKHHKAVKSIRLLGLSIAQEPQIGADFELMVYAQPWRQVAKKYRTVLKWPALYGSQGYQIVGLDRPSALALEKESGIWAEISSYDSFLTQVRSMPQDTDICFYAKQAVPVTHVLGYNLTDLPISFKESLADVAAGSEVLFNSRAIRLGCMNLGAVVTGKVSKNYGEKK